MMKFEIIPNKSVGEVYFGMERSLVRSILDGFQKEFRKSKFSKNTTDDFGYCHVFYDVENKCNAIEFLGDSEVVYGNRNLFEISVDELIDIFSDIREDYGSYISKEYSIGIIFEENKIEAILIGCKGYYY